MSSSGSRRSACVSLEWRRLAEPQLDGYDTGAVMAIRGMRKLAGRRPLPRFCYCYGTVSGFSNASLDHPSIGVALRILRAWPEGWRQFRVLMNSVHPVLARKGSAASFSNSDLTRFGTMWSSVDDPIALAENVVHEMAHHKLKTYGVPIVGSSELLLNSERSLFLSPVIFHSLRPLSAVLHAEYSRS